MPSLDEAVTEVLRPVFADEQRSAGLLLETVTVTTAGRRRVVRVVVDLAGDEPGEVDMEAVATVSAEVSQLLDSAEVLGASPYTLEVTSPGVERPLTSPRHWSRARGRLVRAVLADGGELLGRVGSVDGAGVLLLLEPQAVKGRPPRARDVGVPREVPFGQLVRGEVQVEFRRGDDGAGDELEELAGNPVEEQDDAGREDER